MSSEASPTRARRRTGGTGFRRAIAVSVVALVVLVAVLGVLGAIAPPRSTGVSVNAAATTERPGQRLAISLSQPVQTEGATLSVEPAAAAELVLEGSTATVRFTGMLDYATEYTVRIDGLRGTATGAAGSVETTFATPDPGVVTLVRSTDGGDDRIVRSPIAGTDAVTIAEAPAIGDLAVAGDTVAISVDDGGGARVRILVPDEQPVDASGPYEASIRALRGTTAGLFGWIISRGVDGERDYVNTLVVYDLAGESASTNVPVEITAPGGAALLAVDWAWVPGTTSLVVQDQDGFSWLADSTGGDPVLLGNPGILRGFVPGTAMALTEDGADLLVTDLATGESSPFGLRPPTSGDDTVPGESAVLSVDASAWIVHRLDRTRTPSLVGSSIVRTDADGETLLFETSADGAIILDLCVSPNGQYVAATVASTTASTEDAEAQRPTTVLVDARTGGTSRSVPGESITWCG
jgi:hypothetical protein